MRAWVYQDDKQVKKVGEARASWYCGWYDPDGKRRCQSHGHGAEGKKLAFRHRNKVTAELLTCTYQSASNRLTPDVLQALMQHKDYQTTQRYINIARQLRPAAHDLYVPPVVRPAAEG
jgi:hypothetical protein